MMSKMFSSLNQGFCQYFDEQDAGLSVNSVCSIVNKVCASGMKGMAPSLSLSLSLSYFMLMKILNAFFRLEKSIRV